MINAEQVALTLHQLHADDRGWLLDQLTHTERDLINNLIGQQLHDSNVQDNKFEQAVAKETSHRAESQQAHQLSRLSPGQIAFVLESEPDWVIAIILSAHEWAWKNAVLELLGPHRKASILRLGYGMNQPHRMQAVLQEQLLKRALPVPRDDFPVPSDTTPAKNPLVAILRNRFRNVKKWRP